MPKKKSGLYSSTGLLVLVAAIGAGGVGYYYITHKGAGTTPPPPTDAVILASGPTTMTSTSGTIVAENTTTSPLNANLQMRILNSAGQSVEIGTSGLVSLPANNVPISMTATLNTALPSGSYTVQFYCLNSSGAPISTETLPYSFTV